MLRAALLALLALVSASAQQAGQERAPDWASFTDEEMRVVAEINRIRMNPRPYAAWLKGDLRRHMDGTLWRLPNRVPIRTEEGLAAIDEAIAFLESVAPCGPLKVSDALAKAAQDFVREQGPTGQTGHKGPDGSTLESRLEKHGEYTSVAGEVILYGTENPRFTMIQLVIDDGVKNRGHRKAIFNPEFKLAGPATGAHKDYVTMTVVDMADGFTPRAEAPPKASPEAPEPAPPAEKKVARPKRKG